MIRHLASRPTLMLTLVAAVCTLGLVIAGVRAQGVTTRPATSRPAEADAMTLLGQRTEAYRRIERIVERQAREGAASPSALHEARVDRLESELDVAKTDAAYRRIQDEIVQELRAEEARVAAAATAGRASEIDVLRATIARLEAEIEIAWESEDEDDDDDAYGSDE